MLQENKKKKKIRAFVTKSKLDGHMLCSLMNRCRNKNRTDSPLGTFKAEKITGALDMWLIFDEHDTFKIFKISQ